MSNNAGYQTATVAQLAERLLRAHERGEKAAVILEEKRDTSPILMNPKPVNGQHTVVRVGS